MLRWLAPLEARKKREAFSFLAIRQSMVLQNLYFRLLASKIQREYIFVVLGHSTFAILLQQP